jgi:glycosyltransferase involved in cell wall biosynthesis
LTRRHVAFITPGWSRTSGDPALPAVEAHLRRLVKHERVTVVALRHPPREAWRTDELIRVRALGWGTRAGALARSRLQLDGIATLARLHRSDPIDLVHGLWADEPGALAVIASRVLGKPAIVSVMGGELARLSDIGYGAAIGRGGRWTTRLALARADAVTSGSEQLRDAIATSSGRAVELMPLGVDLPTDDDRSPGDVVLFVGSLTPVKDPVTALRAFALASGRSDHTRLAVVGNGPLRRGLKRLASHLGIADLVDFHGQLPRAELVQHYRSAAALLLSSRHESQSMVACEAAACATPVVGTAVGVVPELADAGGGIGVPVGDVRALATALSAALGDAAARARMGERARQVAEARWNLDATVARWLRLHEQVAASHPDTR